LGKDSPSSSPRRAHDDKRPDAPPETTRRDFPNRRKWRGRQNEHDGYITAHYRNATPAPSLLARRSDLC
jgi:hypothetical protein